MNDNDLPSPEDFYSIILNRDIKRPHDNKVWVDGGLCPFHEDEHSGTFYIHIECGAFNCFSCGAKGGSIIAFMQRRYGISYIESILRIEEGRF